MNNSETIVHAAAEVSGEQNERERPIPERLPSPEEFITVLEANEMPEHARVYRAAVELSNAIKEAGGQALLVGGCVRDMLAHKIPKDFDIEVYRLQPKAVEEIAKRFGKVSEVGKAFGILKISLGEGVDIDLSLPRTDSKTGVGHRNFDVIVDPDMSIVDAARRRDFTINSMAGDPLTGKIYDPFGGAQDLKDRVLRVTDAERFHDDPLRVMRALQFAGRLGLSIEPESRKIISSMAPELKDLPKERLYEEWKKLLLKSGKPSLGLAAGMALGVFREIHPEFPPLAETPQETKWHPEGDAWIHTLMSVDEAAKIIRREQLDEDTSLTIMLATLCHDLGKPATTNDEGGRITAHGHESAGAEPTEKFLASLGAPTLVRDKVARLVVNHLTPIMLYEDETIRHQPISDGTIRRLAERLSPATINELVVVSEADHIGRGPFEDPEIPAQLLLNLHEFSAGPWLLARARAIQVEKSRPASLLMGRDLIGLGFKSGENIGQIIKLANALRDEKGLTREAVLQLIYGRENDPQAAIDKLTALLKNK
jgi:tRNA nucleotidyltransferase (CCA-adding enzyme)